MNSIFRKEALNNAKSKNGSPIRLIALNRWGLPIFFSLTLFVFFVFLANVRYTRKESVIGYVVTKDGSHKVIAPRAGIVAEIYVNEGESVKVGQKLLATSSDPDLEGGSSLTQELKLSIALQNKAHGDQLASKLAQLDIQIKEIEQKRATLLTQISSLERSKLILEKRLLLQHETILADNKLADLGMIPKTLTRQHEDIFLVTQEQYQQASRDLENQRGLYDQLGFQYKRISAEINTATFEAVSLKEQLKERKISLESTYSNFLISPIDGLVSYMNVKVGSTVNSNQQLAMIVPERSDGSMTALEVELWAPSKAIGFVRRGSQIRIMYDAFSYQTFGVGTGKIKEISKTPINPNELSIPMEAHEQLFKIRVALDETSLNAYGQEWPLSPGMRLTADIVLDEQTLLELLIAPLKAFGKRF